MRLFSNRDRPMHLGPFPMERVARAPYPADPQRLANELKANCYFLNGSLAGCCAIPETAWTGARIEGHRHALAVVVEFGRQPAPDNPAAD